MNTGPDPHPSRSAEATVEPAAAVVGVDGTPTSWDAFYWACGEAQRTHRQLVAVYVTNSVEADMAAAAPFAGSAVPYDVIDEAANATAQLIQTQADLYAIERAVPLTFVHAHGHPAHELLRTAQRYHADLLVVGKSTKTLHHLAGSLGRRLVTRPNTPIIVVVP